MKCPSCGAENELTWKRYFMSPLGRHVCVSCQAKFRMAHTAKYYCSMVAVWFVIAAVAFYVAESFALSSLLSYLIYTVLGVAIVFPLDKKFDNSWRSTKLRN